MVSAKIELSSSAWYFWKKVLFIVLSFSLLLLLVAHELQRIAVSAYLFALILSLSVYTYHSLESRRLVPLFKALSWIIITISLIHIVINVINVYELVKRAEVINWCYQWSTTCEFISTTFYRLKVYRFITLSHTFFSWILLYFFLLITPIVRHFIDYVSNLSVKTTDVLKGTVQIFVLVLAVRYCATVVAAFYGMSIKLPQVWAKPYAERFVTRSGGNHHYGWIYTYTQFVNEHTPDDAIIFIPPKKYSWEMEGNAGYIRWFIYPRDTISASDLDDTVPEQAEYVLVSDGTWWSEVHGWPRTSIDAHQIEKMWLIDRETLEVTKVEDPSYQYQEGKAQWGLIQMKR